MIQVKMAWLDQGLFASERERVLDGCGLKGIETTLWGLGYTCTREEAGA